MGWKNLKVRNKIILFYAIPLILVSFIAVWMHIESKNIFTNLERVRNKNVEFALLSEQISRGVIQIQQWLTDISATRGLDGLDDGFDEAQKSYDSAVSGISRFIEMFKADGKPSGVKKMQELKTRLHVYYEMGKKMAEGYIKGGPELGNKKMGDFDKTAEALTRVLSPFVEEQINIMEMNMDNINVSVSGFKKGLIITCLVLVLIGIVVGMFLNHDITRPLHESMGAANKIANGELAVRMSEGRGDELGGVQSAIKHVAENLKGILMQIIGVASTVASSSEELSATISQFNSGLDEQARQIEQSATATSEVAQTIVDVAKNATEASDAASESVEVANEGKSIVEQSVSSMLNIAHSIEISSKTVEDLGGSSKKIGDIIDVINDIASQTNLLALNAAIEAARAGEQGRGFAVVADEVRKLAEKTSQATEEITGMIKKIQQETEVSVQSMAKNKAEVDGGVKLAEQAKEALNKIVNASQRCLDQVQSIAAATEEQSAAVEEVSSNSESIANSFEISRESISQINTSTNELAEVANGLMALVTWFKTDSDMNEGSNKGAVGVENELDRSEPSVSFS